ncbi:NAC domain-containing protein 69 [Cardamine amara subsp. amara]|uniref:NAC domain-containing protein 69 n=1 Tax=Cardamine amara subsp. amara TaxID=228776 RepID=A0ABD1BIK6_CARAN
MEEKPGFRFYPTDQELINYYLKNKILGNTYLVDDIINEINILNYHPASLSPLSRIKSKDRIYYFFAMKRHKNGPKNMRKGSSTIEQSWFWDGKKKMSTWVMHEYQITSLSHPNLDSYVICKIFDKRSKKPDLSNGSSEPSPQSLVSEVEKEPSQENFYGLYVDELRIPMNQQDHIFPNNNNPNVQLQSPYYGDDYFNGLLSYNGGNFEDVFSDQELIMQQNRNDYKPKKSLSGIIVDYSNDSGSDAESISAMSYKGNDSVGSSNKHYQTGLDYEILSLSKDIQTFADPSIRKSQLTRRTIPSKQEVKQGMVKTENKNWFITEEAMERNCKNPQYIYLMNFIIGFILLVALIGNILPVYN